MPYLISRYWIASAEKKAPSPKENSTMIKINNGIKTIDIDGLIENQAIRIATIVEAIIKSGNFDNTETNGKIIMGK